MSRELLGKASRTIWGAFRSQNVLENEILVSLSNDSVSHRGQTTSQKWGINGGMGRHPPSNL